MSDRDPVIYGMPQTVELPVGDIGIGSYIVNDYLLTVAADDGGNGYLFTIRKGSEVQTIHLTELTQEAVDASITEALRTAKESGEFDGNGIESVVFNSDYTLSLYFTDGTSVTTGSIRGAVGNGIQGIAMNPDYTLTITFTDGNAFTTEPVKGETGNGIAGVTLNSDYTLTVTYTDGTSMTTGSIRGEKGDTGNGISGVIFNDDYTLTINFTDGTSYRTDSIRGEKGETGTGISSARLNSDYTLTLNFDDGTSYTTMPIRGARGEKGEKGDPGDSFELHICTSVEYDHETRIPTVPYPRSNTLYLVPSDEGYPTDLFVEWNYIDGHWEKFGSASVNLDDYAKKTELDGKIDKPATDGLQGQILTSNGSGGQTWSSAVVPDWNAVSESAGFIRNKPDFKAGTGADSITNRHSLVSGSHSMATGTNNTVSGADSYATGSGNNVKSTGTLMTGSYNTAELRGSNGLVGGTSNSVSNTNAAVAGSNNTVSGTNSVATGTGNIASGSNSSVSGENVIANHKSQTVSGEYNVSDPSSTAATARGNYVEIIGNGTADNARSNARTLDWNGNEWIKGNFKMGGNSYDDPNAVEVATKNDIVTPDWEATEGEDGYIANKPALWGGEGTDSVQQGLYNTALGNYSTAHGLYTEAYGISSHSEGMFTVASGDYSHAEGSFGTATLYITGDANATTYTISRPVTSDYIVSNLKHSHCIVQRGNIRANVINVSNDLSTITLENTVSETALNDAPITIYTHTAAVGNGSHAEGLSISEGTTAHSEGLTTIASGNCSHAEGTSTVASGNHSHAEGHNTIASGSRAHAEGYGTIASHRVQHTFGSYNVADPSIEEATEQGNYIEIVGNGADDNNRSNARTLDWSGNEWLAGNLKVGGTGYDDVNAKEVETAVLASALLSEPTSVVTIENGEENMPVKELMFCIEPVQEGSGDPSPENIRPITGWTGAEIVRTGKSFYEPLDYAQYVNGTAQQYWGTNVGVVLNAINKLPKGRQYSIIFDFKVNSVNASATNIEYGMQLAGTGYSGGRSRIAYPDRTVGQVIHTKCSFFLNENANITQAYFYASRDSVILQNFMIVEGNTDTTYEPYIGTTIPITFPTEAGTVYGGHVEIKDGEAKLVMTHGQIVSYNGETLPGEWISDRDVYAEGTTPVIGSQVVYELATPITYTINPVTLTTIQGLNHIWANTGDISSLTYITNPGIYELIAGTVKSKEDVKVAVSGTAPVIVANQNTRYVCGEVLSLDFTPSTEGICDVIFTSGSTVTVLTIPNTVIFPEWFDPTTLEANKTYEISISDGVYGVVMIW